MDLKVGDKCHSSPEAVRRLLIVVQFEEVSALFNF